MDASHATVVPPEKSLPSVRKRPFGGDAGQKTKENDLVDDKDWEARGGYMEVKKRKLLAQFSEAAKGAVPVAGESLSNIFRGVSVYVNNGSTKPSADDIKRLMMLHGGSYHIYYSTKKTSHIVASTLPYTKIVQLKAQQVVKPEWISDSVSAGKLLPWKNYELYPNLIAGTSSTICPLAPIKMNSGSNFSEKDMPSTSRAQSVHKSGNQIGTATKAGDANYVDQFYARSRLHHLSLWKVEAKQLVQRFQNESNGLFVGRQRLRQFLTESGKRQDPVEISDRIVMHIDFDCFFVSVGLLSRAELRDKPVACCHGKSGMGKLDGRQEDGFNSKSEVASCNYIARKAGLKNGMYLGPAKQLCPNLVTIPYEFEEYKRISTIFYETISSYTLDIEAISCDEMLVDCTEVLKDLAVHPTEFAAFLRKEIVDKTGGCHASAGLASSPLLARLATKKAKPNGHLYVSPEKVFDFLSDIPIGDLPGVGYSSLDKFAKLDVKTCGDLRQISLGKMKTSFGEKIGEKFHNFARGIDDHVVLNQTTRKSVSAEINYGMRMTCFEDFKRFFEELSGEIERRLNTAGMQGQNFTLKLLVRHPDAPVEPEKYMGCGRCNAVNKSVSLLQPTSLAEIISREGLSLFKKTGVDVREVRGIGVHVTRLTPVKVAKSGPAGSLDRGPVTKKQPAQQNNKQESSAKDFRADPLDEELDPNHEHAILDVSRGQPERDFDDFNNSLDDDPSSRQQQNHLLHHSSSPSFPTAESYCNLESDVGWNRVYRKLAEQLRNFLSTSGAPANPNSLLLSQPLFRDQLSVNLDLSVNPEAIRPVIAYGETDDEIPDSPMESDRMTRDAGMGISDSSLEALGPAKPSSGQKSECPLTQPSKKTCPDNTMTADSDDSLDKAARSVLSKMLNDTECRFWLNHFDVPENASMTDFSGADSGAALSYLNSPIVTRSAHLGGKYATPLVTWVMWKLNLACSDEWLQWLVGGQSLLKDSKQTQLQLDEVTASQAVGQRGQKLKLRGDFPDEPATVSSSVTVTKKQTTLDFSTANTVKMSAPLSESSSLPLDMPSASQLDPDVLAALPADLLNEIFDVYGSAAGREDGSVRPSTSKPKPAMRLKNVINIPIRKQTKRRTKPIGKTPNQPLMDRFVKTGKSGLKSSYDSQKAPNIVTGQIDSDGEGIVETAGPSKPINSSRSEIDLSSPPISVKAALFDEMTPQEVHQELATYLTDNIPDDWFTAGVLDWCRDQITNQRLSVLDSFFKFFHREVTYLEASKKALWIKSYNGITECLAGVFQDTFQCVLVMPNFGPLDTE